jgi:hypothetical protein
VRRHDYLVNIVQTAVEVAAFDHPPAGISAQIESERGTLLRRSGRHRVRRPGSYAHGPGPSWRRFAVAASRLISRNRWPAAPSCPASAQQCAAWSNPGRRGRPRPYRFAVSRSRITASMPRRSTDTHTRARPSHRTKSVMHGSVVDAASRSGRCALSPWEMIGPDFGNHGDDGEDASTSERARTGKYRVSATVGRIRQAISADETQTTSRPSRKSPRRFTWD